MVVNRGYLIVKKEERWKWEESTSEQDEYKLGEEKYKKNWKLEDLGGKIWSKMFKSGTDTGERN